MLILQQMLDEVMVGKKRMRDEDGLSQEAHDLDGECNRRHLIVRRPCGDAGHESSKSGLCVPNHLVAGEYKSLDSDQREQLKIEDLNSKRAANKGIFQQCAAYVTKDAFQDLKSFLSDVSNPRVKYFMRVTCLGLDKEDLAEPDGNATTLVHIACERGSINCLVTLLELNASPNVMLQHGKKEVPLHFAVSKDSVESLECARILLEHKVCRRDHFRIVNLISTWTNHVLIVDRHTSTPKTVWE